MQICLPDQTVSIHGSNTISTRYARDIEITQNFRRKNIRLSHASREINMLAYGRRMLRIINGYTNIVGPDF